MGDEVRVKCEKMFFEVGKMALEDVCSIKKSRDAWGSSGQSRQRLADAGKCGISHKPVF